MSRYDEYRVAFITGRHYRDLEDAPNLTPADYWRVAVGWSR